MFQNTRGIFIHLKRLYAHTIFSIEICRNVYVCRTVFNNRNPNNSSTVHWCNLIAAYCHKMSRKHAWPAIYLHLDTK